MDPSSAERMRDIITDELERSLSVLDAPAATGRDYLQALGARDALKAVLAQLDKETA